MIIAYLIDDTHSLLTCSLTCRSWYIAAVPHLYCTLITHTCRSNGDEKTKWPKPLWRASEFGLLPFVTELFISGGSLDGEGFSTKQFYHRTLHEFSALNNVQELSIANLDIPSFIPRIRRYFGQFSPTLRSLALKTPKGSPRQIAFFIGLFPCLEDLKLHSCWADPGGEYVDDLTLIPSSVPPLRGQLMASYSKGDDLARTMIDLFGGVRFRRMELVHMGGTQLMLGACADTLEALLLDAADICGEQLSSDDRRVPAHDFTDRSHRDFDLSRNGSLRRLGIPAKSFIGVLRGRAPATVLPSFKAVLSTIKSRAFPEVLFIYEGGDFYNDAHPKNARGEVEDEETWYLQQQLKVFYELLDVGGFRLRIFVLCECDDVVLELRRAAAVAKAKGSTTLVPRFGSNFPCLRHTWNTGEILVGYAPVGFAHSDSQDPTAPRNLSCILVGRDKSKTR